MTAKAGVRFFLKKKIVVVTFFVKKPRRLALLTGGKVVIDGQDGKVTDELGYRTISLGNNSNWYVVVASFRYVLANLAAYEELLQDKGGVIRGVAARLKVTITNDPPATGQPRETEIDTSQDDADPEDGEDPTP
ncbi:MAG: hypothetical protein BGO49_08240 [Planctomycetales bacterium 71-10]|mgnify:CR=1 FL=1|nr:MAG: hypothetical protein BGO49_08240 [Planctomycetales bacterium 71-10]